MRRYYSKGKNGEKKKSKFGMLSVKAGIDKNTNPTQADRISGAKMSDRKKAMGGGMMRKGFTKKGKRNLKDEKKRIVRELKKDGGSLKKVKPSQKGLKKLPTKVRNKMGYMKKGGTVGMGKAMRGGGCVR